ncbi:hypothetical protein SVAN01_10214 [Stagonosporopsis vannaccii]|nr:hypothetical protein SVAN01_10214 [Stagonosporopsis vannaccii]
MSGREVLEGVEADLTGAQGHAKMTGSQAPVDQGGDCDGVRAVEGVGPTLAAQRQTSVRDGPNSIVDWSNGPSNVNNERANKEVLRSAVQYKASSSWELQGTPEVRQLQASECSAPSCCVVVVMVVARPLVGSCRPVWLVAVLVGRPRFPRVHGCRTLRARSQSSRL